jgi:ATP-dependent RNA helicase DeaD
MTKDVTPLSFDDMTLSAPLMKALKDVGYESPSPIQSETIPLIMAG